MYTDDIFHHEYYSNGVCYKREEKETNEKFTALLELVSSLYDRIEELEIKVQSTRIVMDSLISGN